MTLLTPSDLKDFAVNFLPGTVLFGVGDGVTAKGVKFRHLLAVTRTQGGWADPAYCTLIRHNDKWIMCPYYSVDIFRSLASRADPGEAFSRVDADTKLKAIELVPEIEAIIRDETQRLKTLLDQASVGLDIKDRLIAVAKETSELDK